MSRLWQGSTANAERSRPPESPASEEEFFRPPAGLALEPYLESGDVQSIHHLARYHWVCGVLREAPPRTLLDAACGSGYGSLLLAEALPGTEVVGADLDGRAVAFARNHHRRDNLRFTRADLEAWAAGDDLATSIGSPEVVVCFDTLEHLSHRDVALQRLAENLPADGMLALSTPCGHPRTVLRPEWQAHHIEFSATDLKNLLRRFFAEILAPEEGTLPNMGFWNDVVNEGTPRYWNFANPLLCRRPIPLTGTPLRLPSGALFPV